MATDGFEIVVVGAHLSGMALNRELTQRGGTLVREAVTEASYTLHRLAGGPPARPGLLRVGVGGHAIAVEVWRLPAEGFASFVAAIPAPLCVGTVRLADGTQAKGFLVEPAGLEGAEDISGFGGWRAYMASLAATTSAA
jgi:allophanate hydrolase